MMFFQRHLMITYYRATTPLRFSEAVMPKYKCNQLANEKQCLDESIKNVISQSIIMTEDQMQTFYISNLLSYYQIFFNILHKQINTSFNIVLTKYLQLPFTISK